MPQYQMNAMLSDFCVNECCHIRIKWHHKLLLALHNGHIHAKLTKIFCKFQADETTTGNYSGFRMIIVDIRFGFEGIFHSTQSEQLVRLHTGQLRLGGFCTGREDQFVIAFFKFLAGFQISYRNRFSIVMDGGHFMQHFHHDTETGEEALRGLQGQLFRIGNHITDIVWQTTVGIGDIPRALKNYDFCLLIQSANTGGSGSTACHTAHNDNFHVIVPPFPHKRKFRLCFSRWYNPSASK